MIEMGIDKISPFKFILHLKKGLHNRRTIVWTNA